LLISIDWLKLIDLLKIIDLLLKIIDPLKFIDPLKSIDSLKFIDLIGMNHKLSIQLVPGWLASIPLLLEFFQLTWSKVSPFLRPLFSKVSVLVFDRVIARMACFHTFAS